MDTDKNGIRTKSTNSSNCELSTGFQPWGSPSVIRVHLCASVVSNESFRPSERNSVPSTDVRLKFVIKDRQAAHGGSFAPQDEGSQGNRMGALRLHRRKLVGSEIAFRSHPG
jgi:hypothetical protein